MNTHEEYRDLVHSTRLTLSETFDLQTRMPKDFKELYDFHKKEFPGMTVYQTSPAIEIALLSFSDLANHQTFLQMLAKGIQMRFGKVAKVIGASGWEKAKFVIAADYGISSDPALSKHFKEGEKPGQMFLGTTPLFLLTDLALYMREPKLKGSLWKALSDTLNNTFR